MAKTAIGSRAASIKAERRWSHAGIVRRKGFCEVGWWLGRIFFPVGRGKSWSAAFDNADEKEGYLSRNKVEPERPWPDPPDPEPPKKPEGVGPESI